MDCFRKSYSTSSEDVSASAEEYMSSTDSEKERRREKYRNDAVEVAREVNLRRELVRKLTLECNFEKCHDTPDKERKKRFWNK